jgi:EAL domain-containing protein (putative c-di-GMP-specific phosphodiesterase class I)/GGDEF domain-containing protein
MDPVDLGALGESHRNEFLRLKTALHDRITGLPAYPLLFDSLRSALDRRHHLGVLHVDVANLDLVESLYGWQVLDHVLARIAEAVRRLPGAEIPVGALLAVNGVAGDRIVIFVLETAPGKEVESADLREMAAATRVRLEREFDDEQWAGLSPRLAFRVGYALLSEDPFYRFERRVHAAVEEARTLNERRRRREETVRGAELRRIIREAEIFSVFQPVVDLTTGETVGHEALARGPKDSGFEMPAAMFALSARLGVAADLDRLCRRRAVQGSGAMADRDRGKIFLNVLPGSLSDPEWFEDSFAGLLSASSLRPQDLVLEVTERGADPDLGLLARGIEALRDRGFGVALDDVGTGYASFATIERVRPDYLKVDVSLVRGVDENLIKQELLSSLVHIARRIGAMVVAEGIESEKEADVVRAAGAPLGQGYLFAWPLRPGAMPERGGPRGTES